MIYTKQLIWNFFRNGYDGGMREKQIVRPGSIGFLIAVVLILVLYAGALEFGVRASGGEASSESPGQPGMRPIHALQAFQSFR